MCPSQLMIAASFSSHVSIHRLVHGHTNRRPAQEPREAEQEDSWPQGIRTSHVERSMGRRIKTAQHHPRCRGEIRGTRIAMCCVACLHDCSRIGQVATHHRSNAMHHRRNHCVVSKHIYTQCVRVAPQGIRRVVIEIV